ncbi:MAG: hypothetical protein U0514_00350 [Candidatus Andersenbacteria bacterium]
MTDRVDSSKGANVLGSSGRLSNPGDKPRERRVRTGPRLSWGRLGRRVKLLPRVLTTREKSIVLLALLAFLASAIWWGTRNYLDSTMPVADFGGTLKLGLVGQPRYVNPLLSPTSDVDQDLSTIVFGSLFKLDRDFKLVGDLAESITASADQKPTRSCSSPT